MSNEKIIQKNSDSRYNKSTSSKSHHNSSNIQKIDELQKNFEFSKRFIEKTEIFSTKKNSDLKKSKSYSDSSSSSQSKSRSRSKSRNRSRKNHNKHKKHRKYSDSSSSDSRRDKSRYHSKHKDKKKSSNEKEKNKIYEGEVSNTLCISNLNNSITQSLIEEIFTEKCLEFHTSMPENYRMIDSLRLIYIVFPSVQSSLKIFEGLNGKISINGSSYEIKFTPNLKTQTTDNKTSVTYITNITDYNSYTTAMETTVHEDWICEYCDCKNFSKRTACFKCKRNKTINCRIIPVIKQKTTVIGAEGQTPPSTSLMIRGSVIRETNDAELLEIFSEFAQVKDIRIIRDKLTGEVKDFAFVEYFTLEEAQYAVSQIKLNPIKIRNNPLYVTFSKIRKSDEARELIESTFKNVPRNENNYLGGYIPVTSGIENQQNQVNEVNYQTEMNQKNQEIKIEENIGKSNLRRELTEREKVESEMKKWEREQKKVFGKFK